jgi:hypothetical protein
MENKLTKPAVESIMNTYVNRYLLDDSLAPNLGVKCILLKKLSTADIYNISLTTVYSMDEVPQNIKDYELINENGYQEAGTLIGDISTFHNDKGSYITVVDNSTAVKFVSFDNVSQEVGGFAFYSVETGKLIAYNVFKPTNVLNKDTISIELSNNGTHSFLLEMLK